MVTIPPWIVFIPNDILTYHASSHYQTNISKNKSSHQQLFWFILFLYQLQHYLIKHHHINNSIKNPHKILKINEINRK